MLLPVSCGLLLSQLLASCGSLLLLLPVSCVFLLLPPSYPSYLHGYFHQAYPKSHATEGSRRKLSEGRTRIGGTADEARQQLQARSEELRKKYEELSGQGGAVSRRLMKAFPRMESRQYKETFNELREAEIERKDEEKKIVVQGDFF